MTSENQTCKKGGRAYDYILAPSKGDTPKKVMTPPRQRPLSMEIIDNKMKSAELRRHSLELSKREGLAKHLDRVQEAARKVDEMNDSFSKETKQKLDEKSTQQEERLREQQQRKLDAIQLRHNELKKAEEAREAALADMSQTVREKIDAKMEVYHTNRETHIHEKVEKSQEHDRHLRQAVEAAEKRREEVSRKTLEKNMRQLQVAAKNRNEHLQERIEKSRVHIIRVKQVQEKAKTIRAQDPSNTVMVQ